MSIYILTHKYLEIKPIVDPEYKYLYVGAFRQDERKEDYLFDDCGDNISTRNNTFCELTGMYWIANNTSDEIKGTSHYRRFFTHAQFSESPSNFYHMNDFEKILDNYDCIVPRRLYFQYKNIKDQYSRRHNEKDINLLRKVISEVEPGYLDTFDKAMKKKYILPYNMIVAKADVFDSYTKWLLNLLFELERREDTSGYDDYQARIYGFLSERLLNVWMTKNHLRCYEAPVVTMGTSLRYKVRLCAERIVRRGLYYKVK